MAAEQSRRHLRQECIQSPPGGEQSEHGTADREQH